MKNLSMMPKILFAIVINFTIAMNAHWSTDPSINNPLCGKVHDQGNPKITSDGDGGTIITWEDARVVGDFNFYAQHISSDGNIIWAANGIAVCSVTGHQYKPDITIDESGGAIIAWEDNRNGFADIYAQRVTLNAEFLWTNNGIAICTATDAQNSPKLTGDGSGGAIMTTNGKVFYTTNLPGGGTNGLYAIKTRTNQVLGSANTPYPVPHNVVVNNSSRKLYLTHSGGTSDKVTVYEISDHNPVPVFLKEITVELNPFGLAFAR